MSTVKSGAPVEPTGGWTLPETVIQANRLRRNLAAQRHDPEQFDFHAEEISAASDRLDELLRPAKPTASD
jgi:hypothetical protein